MIRRGAWTAGAPYRSRDEIDAILASEEAVRRATPTALDAWFDGTRDELLLRLSDGRTVSVARSTVPVFESLSRAAMGRMRTADKGAFLMVPGFDRWVPTVAVLGDEGQARR